MTEATRKTSNSERGFFVVRDNEDVKQERSLVVAIEINDADFLDVESMRSKLDSEARIAPSQKSEQVRYSQVGTQVFLQFDEDMEVTIAPICPADEGLISKSISDS